MEDVRINIEGMTCQHCQMGVHDAIAALDGVTMVNVELEPGEATVSYDSSKIYLEQIKQSVRDAGYQVAEEVEVCPVPTPDGLKLMTEGLAGMPVEAEVIDEAPGPKTALSPPGMTGKTTIGVTGMTVRPVYRTSRKAWLNYLVSSRRW